MTTRDALVKELNYITCEHRTDKVCDDCLVTFILARDKKNAEPLVIYRKAWELNHYKGGFTNSWVNQDAHIAIDETLKNLGVL